MSTTSGQAAIATWKHRLSGIAAQIATDYSTGRMTWADAAADAEKWHTIATKMQTDAKDKSIVDIALNLAELKYAARAQPQIVMIPAAQGQAIAKKLTAPIFWLIGEGEPILARQEFINEIIPDLANAPGLGLKWTLEQLLRALGLPTWLLPVIGAAAIGGAAFWAYHAFLAPISRASRSIRRTNPSRRRRRRVRRKRAR